MPAAPNGRSLGWLALGSVAGHQLGAVARAVGALQPSGPTLVMVELTGPPVPALGRHQRAASVLAPLRLTDRGAAVTRRAGGGRAVAIGDGAVALLLVVPPSGGLFDGPVPPDRVLNRYVRGLLAGLTPLVGPPGTHYFGRDVVSARQRAVALLSTDGLADGTVLFEALLHRTGDLGLPDGWSATPPSDAVTPWASLAALRGAPVSFDEVAERARRGWSIRHGLALEELSLPQSIAAAASGEATGHGATEQLAVSPGEPEAPRWCTGGPVAIPIGWCEAWVRAAADGTIAEARLFGDFMAPAFAVDALERDLVGCRTGAGADFDELGERVSRALSTRHVAVLGTAALDPLVDALLAAARACSDGGTRGKDEPR